MQAFWDILDECGFMDLDFVGFPFTWHKHYPNFTIWERLDRAIATNERFSMFAGTKVHHLDVTSSDHKALWISPEHMNCSFQKPFCFKQMWMSEKGCSDTIEAMWSINSTESWDTHVLRKLEKCGAALSRWSNKDPNLFADVLWTIWNRRNNLCLGKLAILLGQVIAFAQDRILKTSTCSVGVQQPRQRLAIVWKAPTQHAYKVNFDGATFAEEGLASFEVVICNEQGLIMASLTQQIPLPTLVIEVKVLAAQRELELTLELGFDNIVLEGDSKILFKSLEMGCNFLAHYGHLTADIQVLMSQFSLMSSSL
nr:hypothetical protein CFP56_73735 [Quercus suber]